jgi:hypothetical protein
MTPTALPLSFSICNHETRVSKTVPSGIANNSKVNKIFCQGEGMYKCLIEIEMTILTKCCQL